MSYRDCGYWKFELHLGRKSILRFLNNAEARESRRFVVVVRLSRAVGGNQDFLGWCRASMGNSLELQTEREQARRLVADQR
jgi:hypothetical protein